MARAKTADIAAITIAKADTTESVTEQNLPVVTRVALNLSSLEDVITKKTTVAPVLRTDIIETVSQLKPKTNALQPEKVLPSIIFSGTTTQASSFAVSPPRDIRAITGTSVNMRAGPGTGYDVVTRLGPETQVEVLQDDGAGWVKLRPVDGGPEGWIAEFLLTKG